MIIDCTMYNGERDLLEIRLATLGPFVDRFIICEGNATHQGNSRTIGPASTVTVGVDRWRCTVDHIAVNLEGIGDAWAREHFQRDRTEVLLSRSAGPDDWVLIGDLDEIPNPAIFADLRAGVCMQRMTQGWLNWFCPVRWHGTAIIKRGDMAGMTPTEVRAGRASMPQIEDGGWHFTYCGGVETVQRKLRSFAHTEYSGSPYTDAEYIRERFEAGVGLFDPPGLRRFWPAPITDLPEYVQANREKFAHLLKEA